MNQQSILLMLASDIKREKDCIGYWCLCNDPDNTFPLTDGMAGSHDDECLYRKFLFRSR